MQPVVMTENRPKLNRAKLRRQAQRVESYKLLITRPRFSLKNYTFSEKLNSFADGPKSALKPSSFQENERQQTSKSSHISSPANSNPSSPGSLEDFHHNLSSSLRDEKTIDPGVSSVMTRSATRQYSSIGAIHHKVNMDKELKVKKVWPSHVSYPTPNPPDDVNQLRDVVTKSFNNVLMFCKTAVAPDVKETETGPLDGSCTYQETAESLIDLLPYITHEPDLTNVIDENNITFHVSENYTTHPLVNVIALEAEDQESTLVIHDDGDEEYETITLHSGGTYLVDDNYFSTSCSDFNPNYSQKYPSNNVYGEATKAIANDHTYAAKPNKTFVKDLVVSQKPTPVLPSNNDSEFDLQKSLNDLLLSTAILKCLVCNETPQEMMAQLEEARFN